MSTDGIKQSRMIMLFAVVWRNCCDVTDQERWLALRLLPEVMRPQLEVAESLPGVLRELTHLAVCVRGQGSCPGGNCRLLVPSSNFSHVASLVLLVSLKAAVRCGCERRTSGSWWHQCRVCDFGLKVEFFLPILPFGTVLVISFGNPATVWWRLFCWTLARWG